MSVVELVGGRVDARDPVRRLEALVDDSSLRLDPPGCDSGVVAGSGRIGTSEVNLFACDSRERGGALGAAGSEAIVRTIDGAVRLGRPVVGVWHSGGARLQDGTASLHGIGRVFRAIVLASGRVPQVSVVLGPSAGGAAYGPALTDFVVTGPGARIFVTGPDVVRLVTGETVDALTLGGPEQHGKTSGVVHTSHRTDGEALACGRSLVELLALRHVPVRPPQPDVRMLHVLPSSPRRAYDVHQVVELLLDEEAPRIELHPSWGRNVVTVLGRLAGSTVGVVANNPVHVAGCLDSTGSEKAARFVRTCDALGVPLVVLVDVPGYLPGRTEEWDGVVRRGAKLLHAFAEAAVPRVTVVLRKAFGGAFIAMNSRSLGASAVYAWPTAEVGIMHPVSAVPIVYKRVLAAAAPEQRTELMARLVAEYERRAGGLDRAVNAGHLDGIIDPAATRVTVARALQAALTGGRGAHSNIPL
jgi:acetyl-CoA/propionyl-CoA carboxylase carboxyl transferase subunit